MRDDRHNFNFHPSISDVATLPSVTDFIVSGFLRASKTLFFKSALDIASLCFSPPDSLSPLSPTISRYPLFFLIIKSWI